jgi:hypothetical protein
LFGVCSDAKEKRHAKENTNRGDAAQMYWDTVTQIGEGSP